MDKTLGIHVVERPETMNDMAIIGEPAQGIAAILNKAWQISPESWAMLTLSTDPLFRLLKEGDKKAAIATALNCGRSEADLLRGTYGNLNLKEIIAAMNIGVKYATANRYGSQLFFSKYYNKTATIEIFQTTLAGMKTIIQTADLQEFIDLSFLEDILIAHELFHHLENTKPQIATCTFKLKRWKIAGFQTFANLVSLGEIGAFSFAQELLGLNYFPRILELIALYQVNKNAAVRLLERLSKWEDAK